MADDTRISRKEMVELFGDAMPIEAVQLMWEAPDDWTIDQVRAELRRIASIPRAVPGVIPVSQVLEGLPDNLVEVLVAGLGDDGRIYISCSHGLHSSMLLLRRAEHLIINGPS